MYLLIYYFILKRTYQLNGITPEPFLTGVVGPILYLFIDRRLKCQQEKKRDKIKENIINTSIIDNEIEQIRSEYGADRVWITIS